MNLNIEFGWIIDVIVYWKESVLICVNTAFKTNLDI